MKQQWKTLDIRLQRTVIPGNQRTFEQFLLSSQHTALAELPGRPWDEEAELSIQGQEGSQSPQGRNHQARAMHRENPGDVWKVSLGYSAQCGSAHEWDKTTPGQRNHLSEWRQQFLTQGQFLGNWGDHSLGRALRGSCQRPNAARVSPNES